MNIYSVLGVNYEVFHSRMLHWLWSPTGDHGGGDRFWQPMRGLLGVGTGADMRVDDEVKIEVPLQQRWRLADLLIRSGDLLILIENKVDPAYQDVQQIADEFEGGRALADAEGRRFLFVLIAPGPLSAAMSSLLTSNGGLFVPWSDLLSRLTAVRRDDLDAFPAEAIRQYLEFARRPVKQSAARVDDKVVRESEEAIRGILQQFSEGATLTAIDVWALFTNQFPDHVAALDARWEDAKNYSAKAWFAFKLQRMASAKDLIEDTGEWQICSAVDWGFPKVRIYRRLG